MSRSWSIFPATDLASAFRGHWRGVGTIVAVSGLLALLQLVMTLYALAIYEAVVPAGSAHVLVLLTVFVFAALLVYAWLDMVRARLLCQSGFSLIERLDREIARCLPRLDDRQACQALIDLERLARFAGGAAPQTLCDVVWLPVYIVAIGLLHPALGVFVAAAAAVLALLASRSDQTARRNGKFLEKALSMRMRNVRRKKAEQAACMRGGPGAGPRSSYRSRTAAARRAIALASLAKGLRLKLQASGLALCSVLVINEVMSPGALIAAAFLMSRAFAALDAAATSWHAASAARDCYARITAHVAAPRDDPVPFAARS